MNAGTQGLPCPDVRCSFDHCSRLLDGAAVSLIQKKQQHIHCMWLHVQSGCHGPQKRRRRRTPRTRFRPRTRLSFVKSCRQAGRKSRTPPSRAAGSAVCSGSCHGSACCCCFLSMLPGVFCLQDVCEFQGLGYGWAFLLFFVCNVVSQHAMQAACANRNTSLTHPTS